MPDRDPVVPAPLGPLVCDPADPGYNLPEHAHAQMLRSRAACMPQVRALFAAGWLFVLPEGHPDPEPWQWRWRRPPRRKGSPGRLFPSTGQAYGALVREKGAVDAR